MNAGVLHLIVAAAAVTVSTPLERPKRQDTIYVLHGELKKLESFEAALGDWKGGELIEKNFKDGAFYFWAYSERTAPQARQFIMPAILSGMKLDILGYDQEVAFPGIRARADTIAIGCGLKNDPFFVAPTGQVQFRPPPEDNYDGAACALKGAMASDDIKTRLVIVGNERMHESETE